MAQRMTLQAKIRQQPARAVRRAGYVPAVVYGHGLKSRALQVEQKQFHKVYHQAGSTTLINLDFADGKDHAVLIREVDVHPLRGEVIHADFYQVKMNEVIRANVPLDFVGESTAVKDLGGVLIRNMDEVELEALPADLPHDIEVDISSLKEFEQAIHISDLKLPKGVQLFHEAEEVVAVVQAPRTEQELEELAEEVKEDVEAVEGVKEEEEKPEEGEATEGAPAQAETAEEQKE